MAGFIFKKVRRAFSGGVDASLYATGVPATAVVKSVEPTGRDQGGAPIHKYVLDVALPGQEPYEVVHEQAYGSAAPGQTVTVRVDPAFRTNLMIDWENRSGPTADQLMAHMQPSDDRIAGTAVINSIDETDVWVGNPGNETALVYELALTVNLRGREPYEVRHRDTVMAGLAAVGGTIAVRVDANNPLDVKIDWEAMEKAIAGQYSASLSAEQKDAAQMHMRKLVEQGAITKEVYNQAGQYQGWPPYDEG
jgi:hypothetical protein